MQHCDPEDLALRALGEDARLDEEHLAACPPCREELRQLRHVVDAGRSAPLVQRVAPPPRVWEGIAAATGVRAAPRPEAVLASAPQGVAPVVPLARRREERRAASAGAGAGVGRPRRWSTSALVAAAASALVLGGVGGAVLARSVGGDTDPGTAVATQEAPLEPLVAQAGDGSAELVEEDGRRYLRVSVSGLEAGADGYYEVWLLDPGPAGTVSLGVLAGPEGVFAVPEGLDVDAYPVVDVSLERVDGDPTHGGVSVLRGTLQA